MYINNTMMFLYFLRNAQARASADTIFIVFDMIHIHTYFYKNNFLEHEAHFCSKFKKNPKPW